MRSPRSESGPVYDRSKWAGEQLLRAVPGLDAVICNPTGIFGPVDNPRRLFRLNAFALAGARGRYPVTVTGGFDLVDVRDVATGLTLAAKRGRSGENYLLPGSMVTMHHLTRVAAHAAGRRGPVWAIPLPLLRAVVPVVGPIAGVTGSDAVSRNSIRHLSASPMVDGSKARDELGFAPRPFDETVRDLVAHAVQSGLLTAGRRHSGATDRAGAAAPVRSGIG